VHTALVIAGKDLLQRGRDRSAFLVAQVVVLLAFAAVGVGLATWQLRRVVTG
jgi:cytochrome oxidase assembly protein ShyY1